MKYYWREPDAALAGMAGLTLEQIGFYNLVIDMLYARDGIVPADASALARMMQRDPRTVLRLKVELMEAGKLHEGVGGLLTANRVDRTRHLAEVRSKSAALAANVRWEKYRNAKQINGHGHAEADMQIRSIRRRSKKLSGEERGKVEQLNREPFG